jgi:hypothetical protein
MPCSQRAVYPANINRLSDATLSAVTDTARCLDGAVPCVMALTSWLVLISHPRVTITPPCLVRPTQRLYWHTVCHCDHRNLPGHPLQVECEAIFTSRGHFSGRTTLRVTELNAVSGTAIFKDPTRYTQDSANSWNQYGKTLYVYVRTALCLCLCTIKGHRCEPAEFGNYLQRV